MQKQNSRWIIFINVKKENFKTLEENVLELGVKKIYLKTPTMQTKILLQ